jgi:hemerythrin-like metal-binding protein
MARIPNPIYESIPYAYAVSGSAVMLAFPTGIGYFSGVIFIFAAVLILHLRASNRGLYQKTIWFNARITGNGDSDRFDQDEPNLGGEIQETVEPIKLLWRQEYECGNYLLNAQHRHLIGLCQEIIDAVASRRINQHIDFLLGAFRNELVLHFETEERILGEAYNEIDQEHKDLHSQLLKKTDGLIKINRTDCLPLEAVMNFVHRDFIGSHIAEESGLFRSKLK